MNVYACVYSALLRYIFYIYKMSNILYNIYIYEKRKRKTWFQISGRDISFFIKHLQSLFHSSSWHMFYPYVLSLSEKMIISFGNEYPHVTGFHEQYSITYVNGKRKKMTSDWEVHVVFTTKWTKVFYDNQKWFDHLYSYTRSRLPCMLFSNSEIRTGKKKKKA